MLLFLNVLPDLLLLEADRGYRVASGPEVLAREVSDLAGELTGNRNGALAFQKPDYRGHGVLGRDGNEHMDVVRHGVAFENLTLLLLGQSVEDGSNSLANGPKEHFSSSFWDKHHVIFAIPFAMG